MNWTLVHIQAKMVRWGEMTLPSRHRIRNSTLEVWGRARYLSVTEAPHNNEFYEWMGKEHSLFLLSCESRQRDTKSAMCSEERMMSAPTSQWAAYLMLLRISCASKQNKVSQWWCYARPSSATLARHSNNRGSPWWLRWRHCMWTGHSMSVRYRHPAPGTP